MARKFSRIFTMFLVLTMMLTLIPVTRITMAAATEIALPNGDFEYGGTANWTLSGLVGEVAANQWSAVNTTYTLNLWASDTEASSISAAYSVTLSAGTYQFSFDITGDTKDSGLIWCVKTDNAVLAQAASGVRTNGWDSWQTVTTDEFTLSDDTTVTFELAGTTPAKYWGNLDNLKLSGTGGIVTETEKPTILVPKIEGTAGDGFMRGADVSSMLSIINSGATYKDFDGNALDGQGFFNLLAQSGVNWIRLRVWNDPFDANGMGYGGGNCDVNAAVTMGKWATDAGQKVLIDFHYSDFWADPGKQKVPKAWSSMTVDEKAAAVKSYTYASLKTLLDAGVDVGMVQVGNETTNSICGESNWTNKAKIFSAGSQAVRQISTEYGKNISVAVHWTNPERSGNLVNAAKNLSNYGVDYDVFATSYYPYWHGTLSNLTSCLKEVANTYGKQVMVAETSWAFTLEDGDGHANTVRKNNNDSPTYEFSVQGQADEFAAVAQAVRNVGDAGVGVFYWENAWIPVQHYDPTADNAAEVLAQNKHLWEQYGSGWASSHASEYDPNDAGKWYGGSAVDNQAMFDFDGNPLESLKVFKYITTGATPDVEIIVTGAETEFALSYAVGDTLVLPTTIKVTYSMGAPANITVSWNSADVASVDMNTAGVYTVHGTAHDDTTDTDIEVVCTVTVNNPNLLINPSFELSDMSMYTISKSYAKRTKDDPKTGSYSLHFYNSGVVDFTAEQKITLEPGTYTFSLYAQGGNIGDTPQTYAYVKIGDTTLTEDFSLTGWAIWVNPTITFTVNETAEITVGANVTASQGGAWGTLDDWNLCRALVVPCAHEETEVRDASPATCTDNGYTGDIYCLECGEKIEDGEVITALGHTEEVMPAVAPKCEESGLTEGRKCSVCGEILVAQNVIPATGHTPKTLAAVEPTCENHGLTEGSQCSVCNKILVAQNVIPALGHVKRVVNESAVYTGDVVCKRCGEVLEEGEYRPILPFPIIPAVNDVPTTLPDDKPIDEEPDDIDLPTEEGLPFADVAKDAPYYEAVKHLYDLGIMNGTGDTTFSPDYTLNRATVVTILYRLEGEPEVEDAATFTDVEPDEWYGRAVAWAASAGIVNGYGDGTFGPKKNVTNEQLAAIIARYAKYKGIEIAETTELPESANVSDWAVADVAWAASTGILSAEQTADAKSYANRAQVAMSIYTYIMNFDK